MTCVIAMKQAYECEARNLIAAMIGTRRNKITVVVDDDIDVTAEHEGYCVGAVLGFTDVVADPTQNPLVPVTDVGVVIDDQDASRSLSFLLSLPEPHPIKLGP